MTELPPKKILMQLISQANEPLSLSDIMQKLSSGFAERSVRRWLGELVHNGFIIKSGARRGTRYSPAATGKIELTSTSCFTPASESIIQQVRRPVYERMPVIYADEWFQSYLPNTTSYLSESQKSRLHQAGQRSRQEDPAGTYAHQIFNRLLIDLSYNSSRLEGNTYSLLDTQKLLLEGASALGKLDEEKIMILNHKEAIRYLVDTAPRLAVDLETIHTLHYLLADGLVEPQYAGKVRDHAVRISGSTYIPFENPGHLQLRLELIAEKAAHIQDPYEQSLFLLIHVTYLQAFADVNKRTGRLCSNIPLIKKNLVPLSFNDVERDDYNSAIIAIYELQDVRPFIDLYIFSYLRTCAMYDATVKTVGFDEIRVRYRQQRRALLREIIVQEWVHEQIDEYMNIESEKIPKDDRKAFVEDLFEDLKEMDYSRLAGLGVTHAQLDIWRRKNGRA